MKTAGLALVFALIGQPFDSQGNANRIALFAQGGAAASQTAPKPAAAKPAAARPTALPRTPDGHPDLQGKLDQRHDHGRSSGCVRTPRWC
jgi:hypothetical protein